MIPDFMWRPLCGVCGIVCVAWGVALIVLAFQEATGWQDYALWAIVIWALFYGAWKALRECFRPSPAG